jgi:alpha-methylacyl-CoA racemase
MTDGAALTGALIYGLKAAGLWKDERGSNLLDGGDAIYGCYTCADGRDVAVGAIEPQFRAALFEVLGLGPVPSKAEVAEAFRRRPRDEWLSLLQGRDACVAPVLTLGEARDHPHNKARGTFVELCGVTQPGPAPRLERTPAAAPRPPRAEGEDGATILAELGFDAGAVAALRDKGVLR